MKIYFGDGITLVTTVMIIILLGFIGYSIWNRNIITFWGRRTLLLFVFGLVICCLAATRDGLDQTIQYAIDGSCAPGLFSLISIPTIIGCIGAAMIIIAFIATPITKSQHMRAIWFYFMSSGILLKVIVIEFMRILHYL